MNQGTFGTSLGCENPMWAIDDCQVKFPDIEIEGKTVKTGKTIPGYLDISLIGFPASETNILVPIPARLNYSQITFIMTWNESGIKVFLSGLEVYRFPTRKDADG